MLTANQTQINFPPTITATQPTPYLTKDHNEDNPFFKVWNSIGEESKFVVNFTTPFELKSAVPQVGFYEFGDYNRFYYSSTPSKLKRFLNKILLGWTWNEC